MTTKKSPKSNTIIPAVELSGEQQKALELLQSGENVFLTGGAGSGKSFVVRQFMRDLNPKEFPILASTGAAAVLIGGRTFHSFFGLGIMDGGPKATLERAMKDNKVMRRIANVEGVIIDEVSMIPAAALEVAEELARNARESKLPWGGMRIIVVGDFAQLPPVSRGPQRDWTFLSPVWGRTGFQNAMLTHNHRTHEKEFLDVLSDVRSGRVTPVVKNFLETKVRVHDQDDSATRLFPRRDQSESFNQSQLARIGRPEIRIDSIYFGLEKHIEILKKTAPIGPQLILKEGASVMFIQNDPQKRWVNGTRGTVVDIQPDRIVVQKSYGREVSVDKAQLSMQDAEGNIVASVLNFPLILAYATTIHKSQGATLDDLWVDLTRLWEPGHAYVALSRLTSGQGLKLLGWSPRSFIADPAVMKYYQSLQL